MVFKVKLFASCTALLVVAGCSQTYQDFVSRDAVRISETKTRSCDVFDQYACAMERLSLLTPSREVIYATRATVVSNAEAQRQHQGNGSQDPAQDGGATTRQTITNDDLESPPALGDAYQ